MPLVKVYLRHLFVSSTNQLFQDLWASGYLILLNLLTDGKYRGTARICEYIGFPLNHLMREVSICVYERVGMMLLKDIHSLRHRAWHMLMIINPGIF